MSRLSAVLTDDNQVMKGIFEKLGFRIEPIDNEKLLAAIIDL
jgi:hypothetical protein